MSSRNGCGGMSLRSTKRKDVDAENGRMKDRKKRKNRNLEVQVK